MVVAASPGSTEAQISNEGGSEGLRLKADVQEGLQEGVEARQVQVREEARLRAAVARLRAAVARLRAAAAAVQQLRPELPECLPSGRDWRLRLRRRVGERT